MFNNRPTLKIIDGHLNIGGCDSLQLAKEFSTPLYVMDEDYIRKMSRTYKDVIDSEYDGKGIVKYASKAFCCKEIYRIMNQEGLGLDVVSGGELYTAMSVQFPSDKIYFHGNNKSDAEVLLAFSYGVKRFVVDSVAEIQHLNTLASTHNRVQEVMLRINVGVEAHTHHFIQTARLDSKFGLAISNGDAEKAVIEISKAQNLKLCGVHCHIGSQIFDDQAFKLAANKMMEFIKMLNTEHKISIEELNMGGGYGIWYADGDKMMKEQDYKNFLSVIIAEIKQSAARLSIPLPFLSIEPGRSIVGEAGITLYTAGAIKNVKGVKKFVAVDGGMFENPRYALYSAKYTALNVTKATEKKLEKVTITGKCCESGDMLIDDALIAPCQRGDIIAVFSTGAYNYSMASNYNRNVVPPVIGVSEGVAKYWVKPQSFDDLIRNDV